MLPQRHSTPYVLALSDPDGASSTESLAPFPLPPTTLPLESCPRCSYVKYNHARGVMVRALGSRFLVVCRDCGRHLASWRPGDPSWRVIGDQERHGER